MLGSLLMISALHETLGVGGQDMHPPQDFAGPFGCSQDLGSMGKSFFSQSRIDLFPVCFQDCRRVM